VVPDRGSEATARGAFFRGLEHLTPALARLAASATAPGADPAVFEIEGPVATVSRAMRAAGHRAPTLMVAMGFSARVGRPPRDVADTLMDPAVLARSLDASDIRTTGETRPPEGSTSSRTLAVALLNKGRGPFRYDFRWSMRILREDLPGGAVLLRYDLLAAPAPERVAVFQGVATIEPEGSGSRLSEALVMGTSVSIPFFLVGPARTGVRDNLGIRATRLTRAMR
jgi:hypothetical protein